MTFVAAAIGAGLGYGVAGTLTGAAIGAGIGGMNPEVSRALIEQTAADITSVISIRIVIHRQ